LQEVLSQKLRSFCVINLLIILVIWTWAEYLSGFSSNFFTMTAGYRLVIGPAVSIVFKYSNNNE